MKGLLAGTLLLTLAACSTGAQDYDVVILGGRVMDPETEFDAVMMNRRVESIATFDRGFDRIGSIRRLELV